MPHQTNLIAQVSFEREDQWKAQHASNVRDEYCLDRGTSFVIWERTLSQNDGGLLGVYRDLDIDLSTAPYALLQFDVRVEDHTLSSTGWWSEVHGGSGEMPAKVSIAYLDAAGHEHIWDHGFLTCNTDQPAAWLSPEPRERQESLRNFTIIARSATKHFSFNLLDPAVLRDSRGGQMPRPVKIKRIYLHGSGWDFRAGMGNVALQVPTVMIQTVNHPQIQRKRGFE